MKAAVEFLYGASDLPILIAPQARRRDADERIAIEQRAVDLIGEVAVGLFQARRRRNVEADFELVDEMQVFRRWAAFGNRGRRSKTGSSRCPAASRNCRRDFDAAAAHGIGRAGKPARDALRRAIERHVDIAVAGDLATGRFEGERIAGLVLEEPAVLVGRLDRKIGDLGFGLSLRSPWPVPLAPAPPRPASSRPVNSPRFATAALAVALRSVATGRSVLAAP